MGGWSHSSDRNIEGTVEQIGWRLTRIRTFDKRPLYIPNSTFTMIAVENPSRMSHRRIFETIGIRYDDAGKVRAIVHDVKNMLRQHEEIDHSPKLLFRFYENEHPTLFFPGDTFVHRETYQRCRVTYRGCLRELLSFCCRSRHKKTSSRR